MLRRHTLLKVNIREQLPRPYIRAPHSCLPQIAQTTNHIRNSLSGDFFSSLLKRERSPAFCPSPFDKPITVLDTSDIGALAVRHLARGSRMNLGHALVLRNLVRHLIE